MRPAQIAREIVLDGLAGDVDGLLASMRPAQIAREIRGPGGGAPPPGPCFNEARANCAGNSDHLQQVLLARGASMRPAQIAREIGSHRPANSGGDCASMRPAQIAREITRAPALGTPLHWRFNEARANCAGNYGSIVVIGPKDISFNEARANCAGNSDPTGRLRRPANASMRPAQIAREISASRRPSATAASLQ